MFLIDLLIAIILIGFSVILKQKTLLYAPAILGFFYSWVALLLLLIFNDIDYTLRMNYMLPVFILINSLLLLNKRKIPNIFQRLKSLVIVVIVLLAFGLFNSSNLDESLKVASLFMTVLISFLASLTLVNDQNDLRKLSMSYFLTWMFYLSSVIISSILQIGDTPGYQQTSLIFTGGINFFDLYPLAFMGSIFLFYYFRSSGNVSFRLLNFSFIAATLLIFVLLYKRTYLYTLVAILIFGLIFDRKISKASIAILIVISFTLILLSVFGMESLTVFSVRNEQFETNPFEEGRFLEYNNYFDVVLAKGDLIDILFGVELFNSGNADFFNNISSIFLDQTHRVLHSDYTNLLYGLGLVGITFYFLFLGKVLSISWVLHNELSNSQTKVVLATCLALIFNGFSDGILGFPNRFFPYFLIGGLIGYLVKNRKIVD